MGDDLYYMGVHVGESIVSPPKIFSHKYNISTIKFFDNVWTSHLGLFLLVLSIYMIKFNLINYFEKIQQTLNNLNIWSIFVTK